MAIRNEFKYDLFQTDLSEIVSTVEGQYKEISRPYLTTLTLYFSDAHSGPPAVDFSFRLRAYAHLQQAPTTLHDIRTLTWRAERKDGSKKHQLGTLDNLPEGQVWDLLGAKRHPLTLKVCQRRHFAVGEIDDETRRITIDVSRSQYRVMGDRLDPMGDMGPRVEVKLPEAMHEDSLPLTVRLRAMSHWVAFGSLLFYSQFFLRCLIPQETHMSLPEIESKYSIKSSSPEQVFEELLSFLSAGQQHGWRLLLPSPHFMIRTRRYHVCQGPRSGSSATIVETPSGRCSLKIKNDARSQGSTLLRATVASHTTDIDGQSETPEQFTQKNGLVKLNEFVKLQRKIPIALVNGHAYQFTVDTCTDPQQRTLCQLEIEYIGSTDGKVHLLDQILGEIQDIGQAVLASPLGASLTSTHVTKHSFFAGHVTPPSVISILEPQVA